MYVDLFKRLHASISLSEIFYWNLFAGSVTLVASLQTWISAEDSESANFGFDCDKGWIPLSFATLVCGATANFPPAVDPVCTHINVLSTPTYRLSQGITSVVMIIVVTTAMPIFSFLPQVLVLFILIGF